MWSCMRWALARLAVCCGLWVGLAPALAQTPAAPAPQQAPPEAWVLPFAIETLAATPVNEATGGLHYLLYEQQVRAGPDRLSTYRRYALRPEQASALQNAAHVEMEFNPLYQRLVIHHVRVWRQGQGIDKLKRGAVQILHRERELERRVLDGTRTAHLALDDVRVGDIVDYAYTVHGGNPAFGDRHFGRFDFQWSVPIQQLRLRLLWPRQRAINLQARNGAEDVAAQPMVAVGAFDERVWERRQVPALLVESDAPAWYDPYPALYWGDFAHWQQVVDWALPLYRVPTDLGPEIAAEIDRIRQAHADEDGRVAAVLRLLQSEIRYLSVSIGSGSYVPRSPRSVWQSRFGDCKDKTLLMVAMLRALGIDASPALVSTGVQRGIAQMQPSPRAFDHVLVQVTLRGRTWWLDPTRDTQHGRLDRLYQPNYGPALVLREGVTALTDMSDSGARLNKREVRVTVDSSAGTDLPAKMTVATELDGLAADTARAHFANQTRAELSKRYVNFYASFYPDISAIGELEMQDDRESNRVRIVERYRIPQLWHQPEGKSRRQAVFPATEIQEYIKRPRETQRNAPLSLPHPVDVSVITEVLLPHDWPATPAKAHVKSTGLDYQSEVVWPTARSVLVTDRLQSLADHVPAGLVAEHASQVQKMHEQLGYTIFLGASGGTGVNWTVLLLALLITAVLVWLARRLYRHDPEPRPSEPSPELQGFGGWLVLAALLTVVNWFVIAWQFWGSRAAYSAAHWVETTTPGGSQYHEAWAPLLLYELSFNLALLVGGALVLVLMAQRRSSLPIVWIGWASFNVVARGLDLLLASQLPAHLLVVTGQHWAEVVRASVVTLLWCLYFRRSRRVALTFVRRYRLAQPGRTVTPQEGSPHTA